MSLHLRRGTVSRRRRRNFEGGSDSNRSQTIRNEGNTSDVKRSLIIMAAVAMLHTAFGRFARADYKQAFAYYQQQRYDKAIQELKPDLDQNPDWEFGHRLAGLSYLGL